MPRIYLNLRYTKIEPLKRLCNIFIHICMHEYVPPLSVKLSESAVFRSRVLTASGFKVAVRVDPLTIPWIPCAS